MARLARCQIVDPREVAAYHCVNRCVRRCYLCGHDAHTGRNYDHRKAWLEGRLEFLAAHFGIDVIGFAIMSNHFHLVLRSRPDVVEAWSDAEVARRWMMLCPQRKSAEGEPLEPSRAELDAIVNDPDLLASIRLRLSDISWLMRMVAEPIARRANKEDEVSGRFWEGRYKCVRLCDEAALLAALAYVDLNPIRAGVADTPEASDFTSAQRRIESRTTGKRQDKWLAPVNLGNTDIGPLPNRPGQRASDKGCLPLTLDEYLQLLDWTGRQFVRGKRGSVPTHLPPILERIGVSPTNWLPLVEGFGRHFHRVAGQPHSTGWQRFTSQSPHRFRAGRSELLS
jgi:hypothetical protein